MASVLGSGVQMISWIHIDDLCRIYWEAISKDSWHGVYNAVAPVPVSNKELSVTLARNAKGGFFIPLYVPSFALKGLFGEMSVEVLKSTTVGSKKISATGFPVFVPLHRSCSSAAPESLRFLVGLKNRLFLGWYLQLWLNLGNSILQFGCPIHVVINRNTSACPYLPIRRSMKLSTGFPSASANRCFPGRRTAVGHGSLG